MEIKKRSQIVSTAFLEVIYKIYYIDTTRLSNPTDAFYNNILLKNLTYIVVDARI